MKPKVLQVLDDHSIGGVTQTMRCLANSRLGNEFEFKLVRSRDVLPILQTEHPEIVIFRNPCSWERSLNLALIKLYTKHLIIHEHHYSAGFETHNVENLARFRAMLKLCYGLVDRVVAISEGQQKWMQQNHLVSSKKLTLINQCCVCQKSCTVPSKILHRPLVLGAYGRFSKQKGFDVLLQAFRLVSDLNLQLNLGGYGEDEALLKQLAQGQPNIKFWGTIQDVPAFLSACDVVVIPSRWEPWGNVCVESKASSKPVIVSDVDGLSEQVQDCGILVPPDDPQSLADAIRAIATLPTQSLEIWGNNGRESVQNAWETYVSSWELLLRKTLNS
ncbi:glycosyltransferase family 4 protein [Phormidesmis priestleyi]